MLHDDEVDAVLFLDGVDRHDVRVTERGCGARFAKEIVAACGGVGPRQHLDRDRPVQMRITGAVDRAHAALADDGFDRVMRKRRADHDRLLRGGRDCS